MTLQKLMVALAATMFSGIALASTLVVNTSDNLIGRYSVYDSGVYEQTWTESLYTNYSDTLTQKALSTFQDIYDGQWYQKTEFTNLLSYDYVHQDYTRLTQEAQVTVDGGVAETAALTALNTYSVATSGIVGDQWIEMSFSNATGTAVGYDVFMKGTTGSKKSPRGNTQLITPAFVHAADGGMLISVLPNSQSGEHVSFSSNGLVNSDMIAVAEATDGGTITSMGVYMYGAITLSGIRTQHFNYANTWEQDIPIAPPVPEPETYAMLLAGLGLVGAVARRRKQNNIAV